MFVVYNVSPSGTAVVVHTSPNEPSKETIDNYRIIEAHVDNYLPKVDQNTQIIMALQRKTSCKDVEFLPGSKIF